MISDESWLLFKSGIFSYTNKVALFVTSLLYAYLIANALAPEEYGLAMFLLAFIGNLVYLFGTELFADTLVVFIPRTRSKKLFLKLLKILLLLFLLLFAIFCIFSQQLSLFLFKGDFFVFKFSAFIFLLFPLFLLFEALFKGLKSFGKVLKVSFAESCTNLFFAIIFVIVLQKGIVGIIFAKILSLTFASILYFYFFTKVKFEEKQFNMRDVKEYIKGTFAAKILKTLSTQTMLFYMGLFISNVFLGLYYIAEGIVSYAVEMPIAALSETMLPFASEKSKNKNALSRMVSLNIKFAIILGLAFGLIITLAGKFLLTFLFPKYVDAYWLLPFFVLIFLGTAVQFISNAYKSINRVDVLVKSSILMFFITVVFGYLLISKFAILGLLFLRILANVASGVFLYLNQKKVGLEIEIIPRFKDVLFFASVFKTVVKRILFRLGF